MEFTVTEVKALGGIANSGFASCPASLSIRLQARLFPGDMLFTLHAVVPYSPEFGAVQIGDKFKFEKLIPQLQQGSKAQ